MSNPKPFECPICGEEHRYIVPVVQTDIDQAVRGQVAHCVWSTAIGRVIPDALKPESTEIDVRFTIANPIRHRLIYDSPPPIRSYVVAFDDGEVAGIVPGTAVLERPSVQVAKPATARRLITKPESVIERKPQGPTRTRTFGQRSFRVNQKTSGERVKIGEAQKGGEFGTRPSRKE